MNRLKCPRYLRQRHRRLHQARNQQTNQRRSLHQGRQWQLRTSQQCVSQYFLRPGLLFLLPTPRPSPHPTVEPTSEPSPMPTTLPSRGPTPQPTPGPTLYDYSRSNRCPNLRTNHKTFERTNFVQPSLETKAASTPQPTLPPTDKLTHLLSAAPTLLQLASPQLQTMWTWPC